MADNLRDKLDLAKRLANPDKADKAKTWEAITGKPVPGSAIPAVKSVTLPIEKESFFEKLGRYLGNSSDSILPLAPINSNPETQKAAEYVAGKTISGAIGTAKGLVNELGYLGQGAARGAYAVAAAQNKMQDALTGKTSAVTQNTAAAAKDLANQPLKTYVNWGQGYDNKLNQFGIENKFDKDKGLQTAGNVAQAIGGMVPSIASNLIVPGSGLYVMAAGAAGNATEQAVNGGAETGKALMYGAAVGATEAATEKLFNGVAGVFGKGTADDVIKGLVKKLSKDPTTQKAAMALANTLGEGFEEWLTEYAESYENKLLINQDSRNFKQISSDALYSGAIGSLTSLIMQGADVSTLSGKEAGELAASMNETVNQPQAQDVAKNPNATAKLAQDIAQQRTQAPTIEQNDLTSKLPIQNQNATQGVVEPVVDNKPMEMPREQTGPHIDERVYSDVSSRKVNAFQFDNPELHEHYAVAANGLQNDLRMATKGERFGVKDSDGYYVDSIGIKRSVSPEIEALLDNAKLSYAQIEKGLADLIADHGQENYAAAKKIELVLDDMLTNGYEVEGYQIEPDYEYIQKKEAIKSGEHSNEYAMTEDEWNALLKSEPATSPAQPAIFPENSLGAKIAQQLPEGTGAASNSFVPEQKVSKVFTNTYQKTDSLTDEQRAQMKPEDYQYDVRGHAQNETAAQQRVDVDYEGEIADLNAKQEWTGEDVFTAKKILDKISADAEKSGDFAELNKWTKTIQERGTRGGQTVEAFKAFQKTPEGAVIKAQQVVSAAETKLTTKTENGKKVKTAIGRKISSDVDNVTKAVDAIVNGRDTKGMAETLNKVTLKDVKALVASGTYDADAINDLVRSKYGIPTLSAADVQKIYELNKLAQETSNDYQKRVYLNRAARVISNKLPVTGKQKVLAVRRIAMLLNPKTLISRNAGGNVVFGILDNIKDAPGTLVDMIVSQNTGKRTTSYNPFATAKAEFLGAKKGLSEWGKDVKNKVDTSPTEHEMPHTPSFKGAVGRGFEGALNKLLQLGDRPFYEAAKAKRLDELRRLGLDYTSEDAIAEANVYALERVFQNNSTLAKKAVQLRDSLGVLGDVAIPFAQTPANIFDKLADYSPYGFVRAIKKAGTIKDSAWSQKQFVDTLSRSLTGTGILAFAYFAAQAGLISGGDDREEDEGLSYQKKMSGWQPYSIVIGDKTYTYDWMTVGGALLSLGADIAQSENAGDTMLAILSAGAKAGINTMFNQSYLEGISELFGGEDIASGLESVLLGLPASFTPTAFQQIAKIIDPIARDTYDTDPLKRSWNKVKAKLPYASKTLPAKVGASGKEMTHFQGGALWNAFESVLSPGYLGEKRGTAVDDELMRLFKATGETGALADWSKYTTKGDLSFTNNNTPYIMSLKEWEQFQKDRGETTYDLLGSLLKTDGYKDASDERKAKLVEQIIGYSTDTAKREYVGDEYESSDYKKVYEAEKQGIEPTQYFLYKDALDTIRPEGGTPAQYQYSKAIDTLDLPTQYKSKLWEIQNGGESDKNPFTGILAQKGMAPEDCIKIMEEYNKLDKSMDGYTKAEDGPSKSQVQAAYFMQWLESAGYTKAQTDYIADVFKTWQMIPIEKPSKKALAYVEANPR